MDISRAEQRILHHLAQGGRIEIIRDGKAIIDIRCFTRDGWVYPGFNLELFRKLKRKKAISSSSGKPYRITQQGLYLVRSELNNR